MFREAKKYISCWPGSAARTAGIFRAPCSTTSPYSHHVHDRLVYKTSSPTTRIHTHTQLPHLLHLSAVNVEIPWQPSPSFWGPFFRFLSLGCNQPTAREISWGADPILTPVTSQKNFQLWYTILPVPHSQPGSTVSLISIGPLPSSLLAPVPCPHWPCARVIARGGACRPRSLVSLFRRPFVDASPSIPCCGGNRHLACHFVLSGVTITTSS